jgi:uncharacterized Zn finger protein
MVTGTWRDHRPCPSCGDTEVKRLVQTSTLPQREKVLTICAWCGRQRGIYTRRIKRASKTAQT